MSGIARRITGLTGEQLFKTDFNTNSPDVQEELKRRNEERKRLRNNIPKALK